MLDSAVPRKTLQGQRELVDRRQKLHARSRSLLIAVHGAHSVAELKRQFAALGDVGSILDELSALGLIAADGMPSASAANPGAAAPADAELPPLQLARAFINETAVAALGLRAFLFTLKLERCYTKAELTELLAEYRRVLGKAKGEEFAVAMALRVEDILRRA
ncbi:MAG TPA: hypothetical protein VLF18_21950 [Tahibacter sp.]|uniref:hypothetical protein n=1 Tax=Tahibacter sp. TaxID=2056211 RepID=UPI002B7EB479|nr:hypothetical protein [Tahibacter sp.]HSX62856.1 hypothetical protein [Tahibacter sp.]